VFSRLGPLATISGQTPRTRARLQPVG
jgi:hypothetical protein